MTGDWRELKECIVGSVMVCTVREIRHMDMGMWHEWGRKVVHIWFWLENVKERYHFENLGVDGRFK